MSTSKRIITAAFASIIPAVICFQSPACAADPDQPRRVASNELFKSDVLPVVQKYCVDCHGADEPECDVSLHDLSHAEHVYENRDTWVRAIRLMGVDGMPPKDHDDRPSAAEKRKMIEWLDLALFHVDCDVADDAGRVTIHRLNRTEYTNTVRDLLGVDIDPAKDSG